VGDQGDDDDIDGDVEQRIDRRVLTEWTVIRDDEVDDLDRSDRDETGEGDESPLALARTSFRMPERREQTADDERRGDRDGVLEVVELPEVEHRDRRPQPDGDPRAQPPR